MSINECHTAHPYTGLTVVASTVFWRFAMLNETLIAAFLAAFMPAPAQAADTAPSAAAVQKKAQAQDRIYGSQLMTPEERSAYRDRMKQAKTQTDRDKIRQEHHDQMQQRAKERGVTLPQQQPRKPARAAPKEPGQGMGPGQGMAPGAGAAPGPGAGRGPNR
jgi:hypothetical protein